MDQTINRGYPYPECAPPLTKDASDIAHLYNLAQAVADDVQAINDRADDVLIRPDGCRRTATGTVTESQHFPIFTGTTYDTTGGAMSGADAAGGILLVEPGYYMIGASVLTLTTTPLSLRVAFLQGGIQATPFGPQAAIVATNQQRAANTAWVYSEEPDVTVGLWLRNSAALPNFNYTALFWVQQIAQR